MGNELWVWGVVGFLLGVVLGSFATVLQSRVVKHQALGGRSYCPRCQKTLRWYDLIPIFSYLILWGKCRYCGKKISLEYPLTEVTLGVLVGLLFVQAFLQYTFQSSTPSSDFEKVVYADTWKVLWELIFKIGVVLVLVTIFVIDLKTTLIPDKITYPAILVSAVYLILGATFTGVWQPSLGAALSGLGLAAFFTTLILVTKGKGMGWGDVKYVLFLGLALGFPYSLLGVFLAFLSGALVSVGLLILGKKHFGQTIPFGPFLSLGALIALFWGKELINWYLGGVRF